MARALFFGGLLVLSLHRDFRPWSDVSSAFWRPIALFHRFPHPVLPAFAIEIVQIVWRVSLALAAIGLFSRCSAGVSLATGAYLLGLPNNFGKVQHTDGLVLLATLVLASSRSGDAFSVDRLLRRRGPAPASGEYRWPIVLNCTLLSLVFFGAGVSKLRIGGAAWFTTDNLSYVFLRHQYPVSSALPLTDWGVWLARHRLLCRAIAFSVVVLEFAYPLALFWAPARRLLVPSAILMLVGFRVLMGPDFSALIVAHVFWIPWMWLSGSRDAPSH